MEACFKHFSIEFSVFVVVPFFPFFSKALKGLMKVFSLNGLIRPIFKTLYEAIFKVFGDFVKALFWLERPYFSLKGLIFLRKQWRLMVKLFFVSLFRKFLFFVNFQ